MTRNPKGNLVLEEERELKGKLGNDFSIYNKRLAKFSRRELA